jgi:drug/metabolite transporter (DMT)-like permease
VVVTLALVCAVAYGVSDFVGGLAARQSSALRVLLVSQPLGAVGLVVLAGFDAAPVELRATAIGACAGIAGALGVLLLYAGLAIGPMSVVAPLTALCAAVVPVGAGMAMGERPPPLALVGVVLALAAVVLVGREPGGDTALAPRGIGLALLAGVGFGVFFVLLDVAGDEAGLWPLVAGRISGSVLLVAVAVATGALGLPARSSLWLVVAAGLLDVVANVAFVLAVRTGLLALVAVLVALYPAATLVLARVVLKERMAASQRAGLAVAALSVALIATSG